MTTGIMSAQIGLLTLPDTSILMILAGAVVIFLAALYLTYHFLKLMWTRKGIALFVIVLIAANLVVLWRMDILPRDIFAVSEEPKDTGAEVTLSLCQEADHSDCLRVTSPEPLGETTPVIDETPSPIEDLKLAVTDPTTTETVTETLAQNEPVEDVTPQDEPAEEATPQATFKPKPKPAPELNEETENEETVEEDDLTRAMDLMALGALKVGDRPDEALALYHEALVVFRKFQKKDQIARALLDIGHANLAKGDVDTAFDYSSRSLTAAQEIDFDFVSIRALINLGYIMMTKHDPDRALEYYNQALDLAEPNGNSLALATLYGNIGYAYTTKGNDRKAIVYFKQSLKVATEIGDTNTIKIALKNLSDAEGRQN